ncbi:MAG TPA: VOC family protein [Nocardioides sp.]|jgi:catechol 2,3-dioxygenase-like lactoylglutathione lyase family enzyme|uniref:VOC family protein n=1 Tax=Nocardioides sp. TaxID=35761 RepID=UPI002E2FEA05|nr:VOC family protein [Nocardioides sp.]HEX3931898.1 VOC family protein [Nocardioides sp.]
MSSRLLAVAFEANDPAQVATFWGGLLQREATPDPRGYLLPGSATQVGLRFVTTFTDVFARESAPRRLHLHLTSADPEDQRRTIEMALLLGGRHLDVGQLREEDHVVLADPDDNAFCVIGPGNRFLAGCGHLGEVACDGGREVGVFWHGVLGWPLVWDQDDETAVQSPDGGTKVAWGGPPVAAKMGPNPQRFELAADDLAAEAARLVALGASRTGERDGGMELTDPGGNEFVVFG